MENCYPRGALRKDALYNFIRIREVYLSVSKKLMAVTRVQDGAAEKMVALGLAEPACLETYKNRILERFAHIDEFDTWSPLAIYRLVRDIRGEVFGAAEQQLWTALAAEEASFAPTIDQGHLLQALIAENHTLTVVLTQPELTKRMERDLQAAAGKRILRFDALPEKPEGAVLYYGEEGLLACRGLAVPAVVTAVPTGFHAQALTGLWNGEGCVVYIPAGLDITPYVPLKSKSRVNFSVLAALEKAHGRSIYHLSVEELHEKYPAWFVNIYRGGETHLPVLPENAGTPEDFDRRLEEKLADFLGSFPGAQYTAAYFDEDLQRQSICYDASQSQKGILVHAVRVKQARGAKVMQCQGETPRAMFAGLQLPGTALVSNFLFFMTPKLGVRYNDLRSDRPREQADAASGHLDYMLQYRAGKRIETFPLFGKTCIGMDSSGKFVFWNYFMGGGCVDISGTAYRWEAADVNGEGDIRLYTPMHSAEDKSADRDTYRKTVGEGRVNVVLLREKVTCIRKGDVVLPSVGVVLSLTEEAAAPLLGKCRALEDGYYAVENLALTVRLDPPKGFTEESWGRMQWAFGGGLTLIRNGVGLCDGHMEQWFDTEGWTSPLSRQTQESNLHSLVKHPRTAIGCAENGDLLVLVFSGRTWRSVGADYDEMIRIARALYPDVHYLMNGDGGGSAMLGLVRDGEFMELSCPSTSTFSCAGQVRPVNTVFYIPLEEER